MPRWRRVPRQRDVDEVALGEVRDLPDYPPEELDLPLDEVLGYTWL